MGELLDKGSLTLTNASNEVNFGEAPKAGTLSVSKSYLTVTTAIVAGTTAPVVGIYIGTTKVGTATIPTGTAVKKAIGFTLPTGQNFFGPAFSAGQELSVQVDTAATDGGTPAGVVDVKLVYTLADT